MDWHLNYCLSQIFNMLTFDTEFGAWSCLHGLQIYQSTDLSEFSNTHIPQWSESSVKLHTLKSFIYSKYATEQIA